MRHPRICHEGARRLPPSCSFWLTSLLFALSWSHCLSQQTRISARPDVRNRNSRQERTHLSGNSAENQSPANSLVGSRRRLGGTPNVLAQPKNTLPSLANTNPTSTGKDSVKATTTASNGTARYNLLIKYLHSQGAFENYIAQVKKTGFDKTLKWLLGGYKLTFLIPRDADVDYTKLSSCRIKTALGAQTAFGLWKFQLLRSARPGGRLVVATNVTPKQKPSVYIYKLSQPPKVVWGVGKTSVSGTTITLPNAFTGDNFLVHIAASLLDTSAMCHEATLPSPPPKSSKPPSLPPKSAGGQIKMQPPPPASKIPARVPVGLTRFNKLMAFLRADGGYSSFIKAMESTGYNNTLAKILGLFQVTLLLPRNVPLPATADQSILIQTLGQHIIYQLFDSKQMKLAKTGYGYETFDAFPPVFDKPSVLLYKIPSGTNLILSTGKNSKVGSQIVDVEVYVLPDYVIAHAVDSWITPNTIFSDPNMATPLVPGTTRFSKFISWLQKNATFHPYLDAIQTTGYNQTLADLMQFYPITILLPLNLTSPDGYNTRTFAVQRLGLHTLYGDFNLGGLQKFLVGNTIQSCMLFPPAPMPSKYVFRGRSKSLIFSGSQNLASPVKVLSTDVYSDSGPSGAIRVHIVDGVMIPDDYYVGVA